MNGKSTKFRSESGPGMCFYFLLLQVNLQSTKVLTGKLLTCTGEKWLPLWHFTVVAGRGEASFNCSIL